MRKVLNLQVLEATSDVSPNSIFSAVSLFGCTWTTILPMSSASVAVC